MQIREIMTEAVVTALPNARITDIAALMRDRNVGSVVLVDHDDRPVGLVTDRDLTINCLAGSVDLGASAESCATAPVVTGEPEMELEEAAALMVGHRIRRLPVMANGRVAGIVTLDDIAVRTGKLEVARQMTSEVARAVFPDFYFHERGG